MIILLIKRLHLRSLFLSCFLLFGFLFDIKAQLFQEFTNPKVTLTLNHPPILGIRIDKVAFNTSDHTCLQQVLDKVISDFVNNGVEVLDRSNLEQILHEHSLTLSGYIDKSTASSIGKILGPSALISIKVLRCETSVKDNLYDINSYTKEITYIARTQFVLKASVQVTDLSSGRIFAAQTFDYNPELESRSKYGRPEAPSHYDAQEIAFSALVNDIHNLFFEWREPISVVYYDDNTCNLKSAYELLQAGKIEEAFDKSLANLKDCQTLDVKKKFLARAYYNMGMSYFINREYDMAIDMLFKSKDLDDGTIVNNALLSCNKAKRIAQMATEFDEKMNVEENDNRVKEMHRLQAKLSNDNVIEMVTSGMSEFLIIQKIKTSECNFDTSIESLMKLVDAGVSEGIIAVMMEQ